VLAGKRSYLVGLLYDNPSASYITNVQAGVLAVCRQASYDLLIHPCDYRQRDLDREITDFVAQTRVDGLILTPPVTDLPELRRTLKRLAIPNVIIAPASMDTTPWSVGTNDREVCAEMVTFLSGLGHRRIAFILGHPDHLALRNRFDGYLEGMRRCGHRALQSLQVQGYNSFDSGVECARRLLAGQRRPTAIFAGNDDMAAGVLHVAHEKGLRVPDDLSVAGFDDIPLASQVWPPLSTIRQPIAEMATAATQLLLCRFSNQPVTEIEREIPSRLVIRASTGPAPVDVA
jgi:LacI family transcriptional regulator